MAEVHEYEMSLKPILAWAMKKEISPIVNFLSVIRVKLFQLCLSRLRGRNLKNRTLAFN